MPCQHANPSHYAFCSTCGQILPRRRCLRCGTVGATDAQFCGRCGAELAVAMNKDGTISSVDHTRYDLAALKQAGGDMPINAQQQQLKVDQQDIRRLLSGAKKDDQP